MGVWPVSPVNWNRERLLAQVKRTILQAEPGAEIVLYGSRCRGDATRESDWDFLVLVEGQADDERVDRIRHRLYEIEWDCGEVLSCVVCNRQEWNSPLYRAMPFHREVEREGLNL